MLLQPVPLRQSGRSHHAREPSSHRHLDLSAFVAADDHAFDHRTYPLAEFERVWLCRTAQKTLDLFASGVDRGFDLGGDLGGLRSDPLVDGLEFRVQPVLLRLQLAEFAYEGGVVACFGDRTGDVDGGLNPRLFGGGARTGTSFALKSWRAECGVIDPCQRRKPPEAVAKGQRLQGSNAR